MTAAKDKACQLAWRLWRVAPDCTWLSGPTAVQRSRPQPLHCGWSRPVTDSFPRRPNSDWPGRPASRSCRRPCCADAAAARPGDVHTNPDRAGRRSVSHEIRRTHQAWGTGRAEMTQHGDLTANTAPPTHVDEPRCASPRDLTRVPTPGCGWPGRVTHRGLVTHRDERARLACDFLHLPPTEITTSGGK